MRGPESQHRNYSRVLVIPDSHLKTWVIEHGLELAKKLYCDKIILLGDYFDDWDAADIAYDNMLDYLKNLLRSNPNVIPLFGNHELSYLGHRCSGFNYFKADKIRRAIENDNRFIWCIAVDGVLYSHAGVTRGWVEHNKILTLNQLRLDMKGKSGAEMVQRGIEAKAGTREMAQVSASRGGASKYPSPLWADMGDTLEDPLGKIPQVVGHTPVGQIEHMGNYWYTDVFSNDNVSDEYLYVSNGVPQVVSYNELIKGEPSEAVKRIINADPGVGTGEGD